MSSLTLYYVAANGDVVSYREYRNAHGGAMYIWRKLSKVYLRSEYAMMSNNGNELWNLVDDARVQVFEKNALVSTFDRHIFKSEHLTNIAGAWRAFVAAYPPDKEICYLLDMATALDEVYAEHPDLRGVCVQWTSCAEDFWIVSNEDGTIRPYNINRDNNHVWLKEGGNNDEEGRA